MSSGQAPIDQSTIKSLETKVNSVLEGAMDNVNNQLNKLSGDASQDISEVQMMQLNIAVSRFNTFITLTSSIYKNLCDGEKTIAQKM